jgi:hypothetical protein
MTSPRSLAACGVTELDHHPLMSAELAAALSRCLAASSGRKDSGGSHRRSDVGGSDHHDVSPVTRYRAREMIM